MGIGTLHWSAPRKGNCRSSVRERGGEVEASYGVGDDGLHSPTQSRSRSRSQSSLSTDLPWSCLTASGNGTFDALRDGGFIHDQAGDGISPSLWPRCNEIELRVAKCVEEASKESTETWRCNSSNGGTLRYFVAKINCPAAVKDLRCIRAPSRVISHTNISIVSILNDLSLKSICQP